jgi:hypothetical protein
MEITVNPARLVAAQAFSLVANGNVVSGAQTAMQQLQPGAFAFETRRPSMCVCKQIRMASCHFIVILVTLCGRWPHVRRITLPVGLQSSSGTTAAIHVLHPSIGTVQSRHDAAAAAADGCTQCSVAVPVGLGDGTGCSDAGDFAAG